LLAEVAEDEWWIGVTLPMLELARRRIRGLVRFIEKAKRAIVYTNFEDEIGDGSFVALPGVAVGTNWERFRAKARAYLKGHEEDVVLQKLRRNKQLTSTDLSALEALLLASGAGSAEEVERASEESEGLGLFIRSLVGLDREAATEAFSEFLTDSRFSAAEIHFIHLIVEQLTANGVMDAGRLYEPPFTDHAPTGPDSLFDSADVDRMIDVLGQVRAHAQPDEPAA
jgi:type I restriction enzyme R subunit